MTRPRRTGARYNHGHGTACHSRFGRKEAAKDFATLLVRVRAGMEVVIEQSAQPVTVLKPVSARPGRLLSESIALAEARGSTATLDEDFGPGNRHQQPS